MCGGARSVPCIAALTESSTSDQRYMFDKMSSEEMVVGMLLEKRVQRAQLKARQPSVSDHCGWRRVMWSRVEVSGWLRHSMRDRVMDWKVSVRTQA